MKPQQLSTAKSGGSHILAPRSLIIAIIGLSLLAGQQGCQERLIATPYVSRNAAAAEVLNGLSPDLQTPAIPVLYVTDRLKIESDERGVRYGHGRSRSAAFGEALVSLSPEPTWEELVRVSTSGKREREFDLRVSRTTELGSFQPLPSLYVPRDGRIARNPIAAQKYESEFAAFQSILRRWLLRTDRKEVMVFVHGFANRFDDAVLRLAQAWHMGGRQGVPIVYTWPAGSGGPLGYAYDRESGEFTILHFKVLLLMLAATPEVERVHIISHSRGTDVAFTALRELNAELRGLTGVSIASSLFPSRAAPTPEDGSIPGPMAWELLKLETWILAAPDLDFDVFVQRYFGENLLRVANRTIVYFSRQDAALDWARWLFASRRRLGELDAEDIPAESRPLLAQVSQLQLINARVTGASSHSYVLQHPSALSDVIIALRENAPPGSPRRPLGAAYEGVWLLTNDYMKPGDEQPTVSLP